LMLYVIHI